jgi:hypothetical protein
MTIGKELIADIKRKHEAKKKALQDKQVILKDDGNTEISK